MYETHREGKVVFLHWTSAPAVEDVSNILLDMQSLKKEFGDLVQLVVVIEADRTGVPSSDVREAMSRRLGQLFQSVSTVDNVILGSDLWTTLVRVVIRGLLRLNGTTSGRVFVHDSFEGARSRLKVRAN